MIAKLLDPKIMIIPLSGVLPYSRWSSALGGEEGERREGMGSSSEMRTHQAQPSAELALAAAAAAGRSEVGPGSLSRFQRVT